MQFSTMITELSTISPKSIAPRLIKLAVMPVIAIRLAANSIDKGMATATINPARTEPNSSSNTRITSAPPSVRFVSTVRMVRAIKWARS